MPPPRRRRESQQPCGGPLSNLQSSMLQSLICFSTSGHTLAWHALYSSRCSGLSLTIWANRRPGFFSFVDIDRSRPSGIVAAASDGGVPSVGEVGCHIVSGGSFVAGRPDVSFRDDAARLPG